MAVVGPSARFILGLKTYVAPLRRDLVLMAYYKIPIRVNPACAGGPLSGPHAVGYDSFATGNTPLDDND